MAILPKKKEEKKDKKVVRKPMKEQKVEVEIKDRQPNANPKILMTNDGHRISVKEERFIQEIVKGTNHRDAYNLIYGDEPGPGATGLLNRPVVKNEIQHRIEELQDMSIASGHEIMEFYTKVMRGEVTDQFGLDAPLSERLKATDQLAKRIIDIPQEEKDTSAPELKISFSWDDKDEETSISETQGD